MKGWILALARLPACLWLGFMLTAIMHTQVALQSPWAIWVLTSVSVWVLTSNPTKRW